MVLQFATREVLGDLGSKKWDFAPVVGVGALNSARCHGPTVGVECIRALGDAANRCAPGYTPACSHFGGIGKTIPGHETVVD